MKYIFIKLRLISFFYMSRYIQMRKIILKLTFTSHTVTVIFARFRYFYLGLVNLLEFSFDSIIMQIFMDFSIKIIVNSFLLILECRSIIKMIFIIFRQTIFRVLIKINLNSFAIRKLC